jgi:preprotein translocase subunit SecE
VAKTQSSRRQSNAIIRYLRETVAELRKVNWPTRQEATRLTIIVLVVVGVMSAYLGFADALFTRVIGLIISSLS